MPSLKNQNPCFHVVWIIIFVWCDLEKTHSVPTPRQYLNALHSRTKQTNQNSKPKKSGEYCKNTVLTSQNIVHIPSFIQSNVFI